MGGQRLGLLAGAVVALALFVVAELGAAAGIRCWTCPVRNHASSALLRRWRADVGGRLGSHGV